jgi:hypothetical protein
MLVRTQAILTSLIFDHALRIRLKADASPSTSPSANTSRTGSETSTLADSSTHTAEASTSSDATGSETVDGGQSNTSKDAKSSGKATDHPDHKKEHTGVTGLINDLVTSDLDNILGATHAMVACTSHSGIHIWAIADCQLFDKCWTHLLSLRWESDSCTTS